MTSSKRIKKANIQLLRPEYCYKYVDRSGVHNLDGKSFQTLRVVYVMRRYVV